MTKITILICTLMLRMPLMLLIMMIAMIMLFFLYVMRLSLILMPCLHLLVLRMFMVGIYCGGQISPGSTRRQEGLAKGLGPIISQGHPFMGQGRNVQQNGLT
jgi:hypothetical protein